MKLEFDRMGRRVDLNLVVVFDAVYQARNLTVAGKNLGLSQPAMSHALSRLRWIFKDPLFVRVSRGVQPTVLSEQIAPTLIEGLAKIREGLEGAPFEPAKSTRTFTIAMADIAEAVHLPHLLRELRDAPNISIRTIDLMAQQRRVALSEGQVDLALSNEPTTKPVYCECLGEHSYKIVVRADHPTIHSKISLAQFRRARHVLVRPEGAPRLGETMHRVFRRAGIDSNVAVQVSSFYPVAAIVARSDLIATVPPGLAEEMARTAPLRILEPPLALPKSQIFLCWHDRSHQDAGNRWMREMYMKAVKPLYARS